VRRRPHPRVVGGWLAGDANLRLAQARTVPLTPGACCKQHAPNAFGGGLIDRF